MIVNILLFYIHTHIAYKQNIFKESWGYEIKHLKVVMLLSFHLSFQPYSSPFHVQYIFYLHHFTELVPHSHPGSEGLLQNTGFSPAATSGTVSTAQGTIAASGSRASFTSITLINTRITFFLAIWASGPSDWLLDLCGTCCFLSAPGTLLWTATAGTEISNVVARASSSHFSIFLGKQMAVGASIGDVL